MDAKTEKQIQKEVDKQVKEEVKKKVDAEVEKRVEKEIFKEVDKQVKRKLEEEVKKRLGKIYEETKKSSAQFKNEFRKHSITAITAAFAFLIALSWRTPIENGVNLLIKKLGLTGGVIYIEFFSAIVITTIAVFVLMWFSKWNIEN